LEEKENKLGESQEPTTEGNTSEKKEVRSEMSFMGHLSELRKRLMYSAIGLVVGMAISGLFIEYLVEMVLLHPAIENSLKLQNLKPF
jgi:sec-independent protein translocase protein TatC